MKNGIYYIGVDNGIKGDFTSLVVMKRTGIREVEIIADYSQRIETLEDSKKFHKKVEEMQQKYNAITFA